MFNWDEPLNLTGLCVLDCYKFNLKPILKNKLDEKHFWINFIGKFQFCLPFGQFTLCTKNLIHGPNQPNSEVLEYG